MVKDKTIKSPVIQSRYTRSNWCVALWRASSNVSSVKGGRALVNMEKIVRKMDGSILSRPAADKVIAWVQTSEGLRWDLFYNRLLQTPEEFRMWKPPINVKVISLRCLRKSVGVLPRDSLCFVTWTCQMTFLKDAELRAKDRAVFSVLSSKLSYFKNVHLNHYFDLVWQIKEHTKNLC